LNAWHVNKCLYCIENTGVCFSLLVELTERILFESKLRVIPLGRGGGGGGGGGGEKQIELEKAF
jgi:hypothetical protein